MARFLLLGNSHAATLRANFLARAQSHPQDSFTFWGLPGRAFAKAKVDGAGILRPASEDRISQRKAVTWGIPREIDLAAFDTIFLVGLRFHRSSLLHLLSRLWAAEWGPDPHEEASNRMIVSGSFLRRAIRADLEETLASSAARLPLDTRFHLLPAPYAGLTSLQEGDRHESALAALSRHPASGTLFTLFEEELQSLHRDKGLAFTLQPRASLAGPWLSAERWLEDAAQDARHMNGDYSALALEALFPLDARLCHKSS